MHNKQAKLDDPKRLEELKPLDTLLRIGLQDNHVLCDVGAGTGIFTIPAALYTKQVVWALEIDKEMLGVIATKARQNGLTNIRLLEVRNDSLAIDDETVDIALMVTVLHEIDDKSRILEEVKRILKPGGKLAVIEFNKRQAAPGPPMAIRLAQEEVAELLIKKGFAEKDSFELGANLYGVVFSK